MGFQQRQKRRENAWVSQALVAVALCAHSDSAAAAGGGWTTRAAGAAGGSYRQAKSEHAFVPTLANLSTPESSSSSNGGARGSGNRWVFSSSSPTRAQQGQDGRFCSQGRAGAAARRLKWMVAPGGGGEGSTVKQQGPRIIISGAPASGKGTQCEMIKKAFGVVHLSTGDMLRKAVKDNTVVGQGAKFFMDAGELVPDQVMIDIVTERLKQEDCLQKGWLLDGFPRTFEQANALEKAGIEADSFLLLNVPDQMLIERVVGRRIDPKTGTIYHTKFDPPPPELKFAVTQRSDDTEEKATVRLEGYHRNIDAVKGLYRGIVRELDGTKRQKEVFADIFDELLGKLTERSAKGVRLEKLPTVPIPGMKPGTSGLRKKVKVWQQGLYLHNFVQSIFDGCPPEELRGSTVIVSGDGRYFNKEAIQTIARIAAANGVGRLWVGTEGLMSTPAVSAVIRRREREGKGEGDEGGAYLGIVLTASHNPGGPEEDFGIKFNTRSGSPATETMTDMVYENTLEVDAIRTVTSSEDIDLSRPSTGTSVGAMQVEVVDPTEDYVTLLGEVFDFPKLAAFLQRPDFSFVVDCMGGVAGPYVKRVLVDQLGANGDSLMRAEPLPDFGGGHPDPNLTYAPELVNKMGLSAAGEPLSEEEAPSCPDFGAALDGDADRNMIIGRRFFVTPSDSLAIIAANAKDAIPYFKERGGVKGVARSMPTSGAIDRVAEKQDIPCFETPTGWKFFGNLMDAKELGHDRSYHPFICGEESFGTGSDHVREKDGLWAVLAWLSVLADKNPDSTQPLVTVESIVRDHWKEYGRNYYSRYDYEACDAQKADDMMARLRSEDLPLPEAGSEAMQGFELEGVDDFEYTDPIDGSVSKNQGIRLKFTDGSRVVFRLSGTGSEGATIRMYLEKYESDPSKQAMSTAEVLAPLANIGLELSQLEAFTGRTSPTVIT